MCSYHTYNLKTVKYYNHQPSGKLNHEKYRYYNCQPPERLNYATIQILQLSATGKIELCNNTDITIVSRRED